jgi:hypothetical protein
MKWGVVLAGATDFLRPAEKLSLTQNLALMGTGAIWTRWCFVIRPKNVLYVFFLALSHFVRGLTDCDSLAAVNFCLFLVGTIQCSRIFLYNQSQAGTAGALKEMEQEVVGSAKNLEKKAEQKL